MDRLHLMNVFAAVAEAESFNGAARKLHMSPPSVTRTIAALEKRLDVKLLNRTTRYVRVTEAGQRYLEDARRILAAVDEADEAAAGINAEPRGQLAITAPVQFGRMYVTPIIVEYLQRYPGVQVSALFLDRVVNLLEEGLDVGIRIGDLTDSSMKAIKVGEVRRVVCASPQYLQANPPPLTPADLARHTIISSTTVSPASDWKFRHGTATRAINVKPRLMVSTVDAAIAAALEGFGLVRLMSYQVAPYIKLGELNIMLTEYEPEAIPIHVLHREGRNASAKVRAFIDLMVSNLRARLGAEK
jgi:DNA-binding transcriptional LysR family regulator